MFLARGGGGIDSCWRLTAEWGVMWHGIRIWLNEWWAGALPEASAAGARGEALAASWLRRELGFRVIVRNWRSPDDRRREIDLVAWDGPVLVFVEVKTRSWTSRVGGLAAVNRRKRRVLFRACDAYLRRLPAATAPLTFRFDVVEVWMPAGARAEPRPPEVRHFRGVALFPPRYRPHQR